MRPNHQPPTHHPSEALLIAYAAGSTREPEALALSAHLTFCAACRERVSAAEAMGGYLLEQVDIAPMQEQALQDILARLDEEPEPAAGPIPTPASIPGLPAPLAAYADDALRATGWRRVTPGIQQLVLATGTGATARLMRFQPGTVLPEHGHGGQELTVVLTGAYTDSLGRFACGDMAELREETVHRPKVDGDVECIALIVTDSPLKFSGWVARLVQRVTGI